MHLDGTASGLVPSLWPSCVYLANHAIYFLLVSNGSMKHFKNTLNIWKNVFFMTICLLMHCRLNLTSACSLLLWFVPQSADFVQAGAVSSNASTFSMRCPNAAQRA